jgi:crotonobetainyl-CoA:carnitine CoA-transferase CaiB-like acyl-CoA transferase
MNRPLAAKAQRSLDWAPAPFFGNTRMKPPLSGIKVLELARILAGPWVGQLLADLGADVVKVERTATGDDTRQWGPPFVAGTGPSHLGAAYFHSCNRGKRCITADFDTSLGQDLVRKLARHADVLIENFKVGGLTKYGLDFASLKLLNPRLVYCSITGFGQSGPYARRSGYDFLVQGMGGVMELTGSADGAPMKTGIAIADIITGLYAANGIQAALIRRSRTGTGGFVDCALLDAQIASLGYQAVNYLVSGQEPRRMGNGHPNLVPYDVFPVSDGNIIIATGNDGQFYRLCGVLRAPELCRDPRFVASANRVTNRVVLTATLGALTIGFRRAELLAKLEQAAIPAGPINTVSEALADPQVRARAMQLNLTNPHAKAGSTPGLRSAIVLDGEAAASVRPAPLLGEHTQEILSDPDWGGLPP